MVRRVTELETLTEIELQQLLLYKEKVSELVRVQSKDKTVPFSVTKRAAHGEVLSFDANAPNVDDIALFAMKFRFFYAQGESTQFEKISSLTRCKAKDEWARNYVDLNALHYKESMKDTRITKVLGCAVTNRDVIDLWFNSQFFHSEQSKRAKLDGIHQTVGKQATLFQFYLAMRRCSLQIVALYVVLNRIAINDLVLCTPNHSFKRNPKTESA
jgi:hypothetical protein